MHRLVAQDVLVLLGGAGHFVLAAQGQDLGEADVEKQAFHHAGEDDDRLQQLLVRDQSAGLEFRIGQDVDERIRNWSLSWIDGISLCALKISRSSRPATRRCTGRRGCGSPPRRLAQQVLAAFRGRDVAVGAQHDVVGGQRVGGDEEAEVAFHKTALVFRQAVRALPQFDVALHVHFLQHLVTGAADFSHCLVQV